MSHTKIDWSHHITTYRAGSQSVDEYCSTAGLNVGTFKYHLYKGKKKQQRPAPLFKEFAVASELVIARDTHGTLTLSGFDVTHLPGIVGAWSHALS